MSQHFDFIALGDIVTDAFIKLKDNQAQVVCDTEGKPCQICMNFGDKIPYDDVVVVPAVGNSPNAAVSASRLGLKSALVTNLGDDSYGKEAIEALEKEGVKTDFVTTHADMKTNYHFVLRYGAERTILVKHEEYPYTLPDIGGPTWLYLSSLGENSLAFHQIIGDYLNSHPEIKLAFQPGTFQMKLGLDKLKFLYEKAELFFCNKEEAQKILQNKSDDIKTLLQAMHQTGPKISVITDGAKGAYVYDGTDCWHMPIYPDPKPPVDRTGAGDSFASTFTSSLALGLSIPEALKRAPINSMSVVQHIGAQEGLLTRDQLEEYLDQAPTSYQVEQI
ncbi:MAG: carbohydrate kinase family protein [Candidatus Paceibacterota bacterium]